MALAYCPALQVVHALHALTFAPVLKVPAPQFVQTRSAVALGVLLTYCPAPQVVHDAQLAAFAPVLKVSLGHALHVAPFT